MKARNETETFICFTISERKANGVTKREIAAEAQGGQTSSHNASSDRMRAHSEGERNDSGGIACLSFIS